MSDDIILANRVSNLGIETAFVVAAQAANHAAKGNKVYPFHLGDLNLKTPENIVEAAHRAMLEGRNGYTPNSGIAKLRDALANEFNRTRKTSYSQENVSVQPGGKPVISKFILALMNPGDEVLYPNPGFPIYESQIRFHGGIPLPYSTIAGRSNFSFNINTIESSISKKTKLLILNDLHNPTGAECSPQERKQLAELAAKHNLTVLLDEAYYDVRYDKAKGSSSLVSEPGMAERSIILYTFSKRYAMTGWRIGAALGPKRIIDVISKLNVNDESCTSHSTQYAAYEALTGDQSGAEQILSTLKKRRDACVVRLNAIDGVSCFCPNTTFYLFPDMTQAIQNKGFDNYQDFLDAVLENTGISMCARPHFGSVLPGETKKYFRLAYSGIDVEQIEEGLEGLRLFLEK